MLMNIISRVREIFLKNRQNVKTFEEFNIKMSHENMLMKIPLLYRIQ